MEISLIFSLAHRLLHVGFVHSTLATVAPSPNASTQCLPMIKLLKSCFFILAAGACTTSSLLAKPPIIQQTQIKGLLVVALPNGSFAGTTTQMNATTEQMTHSDKSFDIRFNQEVGPMMAGATREVEKLMRVRHAKDLPTGHRIEFGFADKYTAKDGPSAAVACALMSESIITGKTLDQSLAVTGDLTATGEVRPIGGVGAKVRGAGKYKCNLVVVPANNQSAVQDIYVVEGIGPLIEAQIITVKSFDQAWELAQSDKDPKIQQAINDFALVQTALKKDLSNASHPKVLEKLKAVVQALPNHESARLIALHGMKLGPKKLSLAGSLEAIQNAANQLAETLRSGSYKEKGLDDKLQANVTLLGRLKDDVDPRTKNYLAAFLDTANFVIKNRDRKKWNAVLENQFQASISKILSEEEKLKNNSEIQSELMNQ